MPGVHVDMILPGTMRASATGSQSVNQSMYVVCLWDSSGEATDSDWDFKMH